MIKRTLRLLVLLPVIGLGACADYLNHHDTVTLRAGDTQRWNRTVQATDPWPVDVQNTDIDGDGQRTAVVIRRYSTGASGEGGGAGGGGGGGGNCDTPGGTAADGSRCGDRAASVRPGGR